jgi:hypothetical protein
MPEDRPPDNRANEVSWVGGVDGTRTRGLRRDRPAFESTELQPKVRNTLSTPDPGQSSAKQHHPSSPIHGSIQATRRTAHTECWRDSRFAIAICEGVAVSPVRTRGTDRESQSAVAFEFPDLLCPARRYRRFPRKEAITVPVLYLDPGFLSFLADHALRVVEIIRKFDDSGRPTPAASTK